MRGLLSTIAIVLAAASSQALVLVSNGASEYAIVVADDASLPVQTAASELQAHLKQVTGVELPVCRESERAAGTPQIVLGIGPRFREAFPDFDASRLKGDGIVIRTAGSSLYLAGDEPRGTLYAVYTFLEDVVGCRWWSATESSLPNKPVLEIPALDKVHVPQITCREAFYRNALDGVFSARMKLNGHFHQVPEAYGGHHTILGWCHTFYQILPPERYFAEHPEWYSEVGGKRIGENAQLCLTNEEMRAEFLKNSLEWLRNRPDANADIISISQNDCAGRCECAKCRAVEEQEGAPSGLLLQFVNAMAEGIEKEYPDVLVETLAYLYTREAPQQTHPRHNVVVRLCTMGCSFSQPLATGPQNAAFKRDIDAWSAIAPQLYIWDYVTNFSNYLFPHPNLRVLAPNVRLFAERKTVGLFEQGDIGSTCGDFVELRAWLLAHLMWDPSRDEKALIDEFLEGYYGPAAEPLQAYLDLTHDSVEASGIALGCYMDDTAPWFGFDAVAQATALFNEAQARVADDPVLRERVRRARLPLDNVWLSRYYGLRRVAQAKNKPFVGPEDPVAFAKAFVETARGFHCDFYREGHEFSRYEAILAERFKDQGTLPQAGAGLASKDTADAQESEFVLFGRGSLCEMVDDPAASNGKAVRMTTDHTQWVVQLPVSADLTALGKLQCYVVARCDAKNPEAPAFDYGIYDTLRQTHVVMKTATCAEAGQGYRELDLGTHEIGPSTYVWIAPKANPDAVSSISVDRIFFVVRNEQNPASE